VMASRSLRWPTVGAGRATGGHDSDRSSNFRMQRSALRAAADPDHADIRGLGTTVQVSVAAPASHPRRTIEVTRAGCGRATGGPDASVCGGL
jgi:hypothetical protein